MDYGVAVSQKGKDVKVTADRFFTVSSAFQSLKVKEVHEVSTTIPTAGNVNTITITHNLGYYAPAIVVYNGSTTLGQGTSYFMADSATSLDIEIAVNTIKINVDENFDQGFSATGDTVYFTVYSFVDDFSTFEAPVISTDTTSGASASDYGFRISKPGFDVKTCADVDCIITSSRNTTTVHKKGIDDTGSVSHDLGYIPAYLGYVKLSGNDYLSLSNEVSSVSSTSLDCGLSAGDEFYYVIFKSKTI